jgi:hypothetical protein
LNVADTSDLVDFQLLRILPGTHAQYQLVADKPMPRDGKGDLGKVVNDPDELPPKRTTALVPIAAESSAIESEYTPYECEAA